MLRAAAAARRDVEADLRSLDEAQLSDEDLEWSPESPAGFSFVVVASRRDATDDDGLRVTLECHIAQGLLRHWTTSREVTLPPRSRPVRLHGARPDPGMSELEARALAACIRHRTAFPVEVVAHSDVAWLVELPWARGTPRSGSRFGTRRTGPGSAS